MTRLAITLPDYLAAMVLQAAGGDVSTWMEHAAREALLRDEAEAVAEYEAAQADPQWDAEREQGWSA